MDYLGYLKGLWFMVEVHMPKEWNIALESFRERNALSIHMLSSSVPSIGKSLVVPCTSF